MTDAAGAVGEAVAEHRRLSGRRRLVPYALLSPAGGYLFVFFLLPLGLMLYTSLQSG